MHRTHLRNLLLMCVMALSAACNRVYAPPIASMHPGTPGHFSRGSGEVAAAFDNFLVAGLRAGVPVYDALAVELGLDASLGAIADDERDGWVIAHSGVRYTAIRPPKKERNGLVLDVEFGFGAGAGGGDQAIGIIVVDPDTGDTTTVTQEGLKWNEMPAFGGYVGVGVGGILMDHLGIFFRGRWQLSAARRVPATMWHTHVLGVEWIPGPVGWWLSGGVVGYVNDLQSNSGPLFQMGLAVRFDMPK